MQNQVSNLSIQIGNGDGVLSSDPNMLVNTGRRIFRKLREIYSNTGLPTGQIKNNVSTDPDYIPPVEDLIACPLPVLGGIDGFVPGLISLVWSDTGSASDLVVAPNTAYYINALRTTGTYTISSIAIYRSIDQGQTWTQIISNIGSSLGFGDNISTHTGIWYKAILTDSAQNSTTSNILKVTASQTQSSIGIGDLVLVYNNVDYAPNNSSNPVITQNTTPIVFRFKNRHTSQIVQLRDIASAGSTGIACQVEQNGNGVDNTIYTTRPQIDETISANNGNAFLGLQSIVNGIYSIRLAVQYPQDAGFPPMYIHTYFWYIKIQ